MITITNSVFDAQGADRKAKVYGITLNGAEDVVIKDCEFKNKGYSSVLNHCSGKVTVENCVFNCANVYNPIEGSQQVDNGDVVVKGCEFKGAPGNNYICTYQFKDGAVFNIENCTFEPTVDNNIVRISNKTNASAKFMINNCAYKFNDAEATEYTGMILCQDYTSKNGVKQDFTSIKVEIDNVTCDGTKVTKDGAKKGSVYYVYEDGKGIITGENDPIITIK